MEPFLLAQIAAQAAAFTLRLRMMENCAGLRNAQDSCNSVHVSDVGVTDGALVGSLEFWHQSGPRPFDSAFASPNTSSDRQAVLGGDETAKVFTSFEFRWLEGKRFLLQLNMAVMLLLSPRPWAGNIGWEQADEFAEKSLWICGLSTSET